MKVQIYFKYITGLEIFSHVISITGILSLLSITGRGLESVYANDLAAPPTISKWTLPLKHPMDTKISKQN